MKEEFIADTHSYYTKRTQLGVVLLANIKSNLVELEKLLNDVGNHWNYEDSVYRFYHSSFKVYYVQELTIKIVTILKKLTPEKPEDMPGFEMWNTDFEKIVKEGTGVTFDHSHNQDWLKHTRPLLEAFFHAKYFLEMVVKYGKELEEAPQCLPSGWASVLYLYNLR